MSRPHGATTIGQRVSIQSQTGNNNSAPFSPMTARTTTIAINGFLSVDGRAR